MANSFLTQFPIQGKSLFMPLRVMLTGKLHGPEMASGMLLVYQGSISSIVSPNCGFVPLEKRLEAIKEIKWDLLNKDQPAVESSVAV